MKTRVNLLLLPNIYGCPETFDEKSISFPHKGPFKPSFRVNTVTTLPILFSLKTMASLQNWVTVFSSDSIAFNENSIGSAMAELSQTLTCGVKGP